MKHFTFSLKMLLLALCTVGGVGSAWADKYVKITSSSDLTDGQYLIVYEDGKLAMNGGLKTLDAVGNTISVTISDNAIASSTEVDAAAFTYDATAKTFKSASGLYIGQTSDANGLQSSATTTYTNTVSFNSAGNVDIVSGKAYLRYNSASNQTRFRYFKSSSYTNQKAIQLYKFEASLPDSRIDCVTDLSLTPTTIDLNGASSVTGTFVPSATEVDALGVIYSYSTSATSGFSVESDGTYTATSRGEYTVEITATPNNTTDYKAVTEEVTITVVNSLTVTTTYKKVTSEAGLVLGGKYLIVNEENSKALGGISDTSTKYGLAIDVTISDASISIEDEAVNILTLENGYSEGFYAFKESLDNLYLTWKSGNSLISESGNSNASSWGLTYDDNELTITNKDDDTRLLQYNKDNPRFACYTSKQKPVALYRQVVSATISGAGYATYCSKEALDFSSVEGVTAYIVSAVSDENVTLTEVESVPANTPVVLKAAAGTYSLPVVASAPAVGTNYLKVSDGSKQGSDDVFALAKKGEDVGFYAVSSSVTIPAGKCYIDGTANAKSRLSFSFEGEDATGIQTVESIKADGVYYNLRGQRVVNPVKGIYILNGKKILVK